MHLPRLWEAPTTRPQDRKRIVRLLIEHIVAIRADDGKTLDVRVHWSGGAVNDLQVATLRRGETRDVAPEELLTLLRQLAAEFSDSQIAGILNRRGLRTPKGLTFTTHRVAVTRHNHGIETGPAIPRTGEDIHSARKAAELLRVNQTTVIRWVETGLLKGAQFTKAAPWRIRVSADDIERLMPSENPDGWLSLKKAARVLGMSQQGVLQQLNRGALDGVRVRRGRRTSWRIRVPATTYDQQSTLIGLDGAECI